MKLVHVDLEKPIAIHRNCPTEWIIESPELVFKICGAADKNKIRERREISYFLKLTQS